MVRAVERLLRLHPGEGRRGLLLSVCLFLVIGSLVAIKAARDALFLERYNPAQLPYVDIATSILVIVVVSAYTRIGRRLRLVTLQVGVLLTFAVGSLLFWWLSLRTPGTGGLFVAVYIWVGIVGVVAPAQVWLLANFVFTTREAKRAFGLVGSGAIAGWIVGGLGTHATATRFGAASALAGAATALAVTAGLMAYVSRDRQSGKDGQVTGGDTGGGLRESLALVWQSPYLRAIASLMLVSSVVTTIAGWQFKALAKQHIPQTDQLVAFFGQFDLYAGLASLGAQLFLTSRILRTFGVGVGLLLVPSLLATGTVGVLVTGGLAAAVLLKGSDQVMRYLIDKATVELLYLPVPSAETFRAKSFIDTVVWRLGDGGGGLLILLLAGGIGLSPVEIGWAALGLIGLWIAAALAARRHYVRNLTEGMRQHRLGTEYAAGSGLDKTGADIVAASFESNDMEEVLYALGLFEAEARRRPHPAVPALLGHAAPEVRRRAIRLLAEAGDTTAVPVVERLLHDEHLEVRTEALLYLARYTETDPIPRLESLGAFDDYSIRSGMVAFYARPGVGQNVEAARLMLDGMVSGDGPGERRTRLEAARLLGWIPDLFDDQLRRLLHDEDVEVARAAVVATGTLGKRLFAADVIARLRDPLIVPDALDTLASFGDGIVETLGERMGNPSVGREVRREIPALLARIGTPAAYSALAAHLADPDARIRFRIVTALNKLAQQHPDWRIETSAARAVLTAEVMGLYRSYQIIHALLRFRAVPPNIVPDLEADIQAETERIFRLLKVLHPETDMHSIYVGLQSENAVVHDNALELAENVLPPRLSRTLIPLLDRSVSIEQRAGVADRLLVTSIDTLDEAIRALSRTGDEWLKAAVQGRYV